MAYTETTTTSYGGRLSRSLKGIVGGFAAVVAGTILLFWNEGNFVKTQKALNEAQDVTIAVDRVAERDPALNGKVIHASARAETEDILQDPAFDIRVNAIRLQRAVEYYQYKERSSTTTRDKIGGGEEKITTYTYSAGWQSKPIDSGDFKDPQYQGSNFMLYSIEDQEESAKNVTFGAYSLPAFFIEDIPANEPVSVTLSEENLKKMEDTIRRHPRGPRLPEDPDAVAPPLVHVQESTVYLGENPAAPKVGDLRITFSSALPQEVSIIGKVNGATFGRYVAKGGKTISRLETGVVSAEEMFAHAQAENSLLTWILRLVGVVLVCAGLRGIFGILEAIAKVLPFLGDIVGAGVGLVTGVIGVAWSLLCIAIAWLTYRPLIGVPLLFAAVALIIWLKKKAPKSTTAPAATP